ncbi:hypothetical protein SNE40_014000 [Patella caerulea]|uniref:DDB1- and CUL4-associated factor 15 WD40 repeat-containing domain-containing protein n=1 Tax=Patella caerulea TaxID=87958 RepID=A0AAN8PGK7_PATCE
MATEGKGLVQKLLIREISGKWKQQKRDLSLLPFNRIPGRMCYLLKNLVSRSILEDGHVFLGFTKSGKFVVSYSLQIGGDHTSETVFPTYNYKLQWWLFVPKKPLHLVSEVRLFSEGDICKELFIAFCEWPEDEDKIFVYGHSIPGDGDDSCFCYVTITAVPYIGLCLDCKSMDTENIEIEDPSGNGSRQIKKVKKKCLLHSFCVHSKYDMSPPYPAFSPSVQLKLDGIVVLNTGVSLVAFQVEPKNLGKPKSLDITGNRTLIGSTLAFNTNTKANLPTNSTPSPKELGLVFKNLCPDCKNLPCFCNPVDEMCELSEENVRSPIHEKSNNVSPSHNISKCSKMCEMCNRLPEDCRCDVVIRQPLQAKNDSSNSLSVASSTSPQRSSIHKTSKKRSFDLINCGEIGESTSHGTTHLDQDSVPTCTFSSPSPKICSERTFFSPSNSNSSMTSRSSEGVHVHTNIARTVTYSSRFYEVHECVVDSPVTLEDEYDLAYRSVLPVDVCSYRKTLSIAKNVSATMPVISVLQMTFDIEHYMIEVVHQQAVWGKRFVAFYNYDLQILDVELDGQVLGTVYALIQAKDQNTKSSKPCKIPIKLYRTQFTFHLNLCTGIYSTWNIGDLTTVDERNPNECEWKSSTKECNLLRRKALIPKSFYRSVHMLSNEAGIKGQSKKMLVAPHHSHTTAIIL